MLITSIQGWNRGPEHAFREINTVQDQHQPQR